MKREKLEIIYSVGVLLAIPALMIVNTVMLMNATRDAFNREVRLKADLVNVAIAETTRADIQANDYSSLAVGLQGLEDTEPTVKGLTVIRDIDQKLTQVAHSDAAPAEPSQSTLTQVRIAYERKKPIAKLINVEYGERTSQAWNVATPVLAEDGSVLAVISSNTLTNDSEEAISKAYNASFIVLAGSIVVIAALLFRHFKLVGYAQLLAKQKELNQTMSDFLSVATHELKAPTTIIKGYISNVMDGTCGPIDDTIKSQLQVAFAQTDRLNELVQDLLNVSRIEQGRVSYTITDVDSSSLLSMICNNYQPIASAKNLQLILNTDNQVPHVIADQGRLQEIFTNLIDNAIKYTAEGTVTISQRLSSDSKNVVTIVQDTGFGMSDEARKRLFQRFYRIKTDQTKTISGTGLGLWIIKQYIEAMGGNIEVQSMEGVGSSFIVAMPISKQASVKQ